MAITELYSGTEAVSTTEWSLTTDTAGPDTDTTDGLIQAVIDVSDMVDGDELQLRVYEKVRSGDTQRIVYEAVWADAQADSLIYTPPLLLMHGWDFTLDALSGGVTCNWSIRSLAQTVTERYSGTEAVGATEHSMTTDTSGPDSDTTDGFYQVFLDVSDMVDADVLQIRAYEKARSADTQRLAYQAILNYTQQTPIWVSPALCMMHGWDWTLDALSGTITCNWSIRTVGA